jgi:hypothetical protein
VSFLPVRGGEPMSEHDRKLVNAAGTGVYDVFLPSHDAPPVYTEAYARLIRALDGDESAIASLNVEPPVTDNGNADETDV